MKPVKANDEIIMSNEWCRIDYTTRSGHGYMILKEKLFFDNFKRFQRVLKGTDYKITEYYKITMKDIIESAINTIKDKIYYLNCKIKREGARTYPNALNILEWISEHIKYQNMLNRLEKKL